MLIFESPLVLSKRTASWIFKCWTQSILFAWKPLTLLCVLVQTKYTLFQNGGCLRLSGSSCMKTRHRGPNASVYKCFYRSRYAVMPQNCCVPECKKKVYVENGVKISFHTFPEERKLFMKWIVAIRRDIGKHFQVFAWDISSHRIIFLHLRGIKGL